MNTSRDIVGAQHCCAPAWHDLSIQVTRVILSEAKGLNRPVITIDPSD